MGRRKVVAGLSDSTPSPHFGLFLSRQLSRSPGVTGFLARCFYENRARRFSTTVHRNFLPSAFMPPQRAARTSMIISGCGCTRCSHQPATKPTSAPRPGQSRSPGRSPGRGRHTQPAGTFQQNSCCHKLSYCPDKVEVCMLEIGVRCLPNHTREAMADLGVMGHLVRECRTVGISAPILLSAGLIVCGESAIAGTTAGLGQGGRRWGGAGRWRRSWL